MVKFHRQQTTYSHPFPAVSLAYFLRYPNPYSTHVLSTDTISRHLDPITGRLHTVRLHLKHSKLPPTVLKLLPKGILTGGQSPDGQVRNFILETTVVDPKEGWMETETRNLQYTRVLTVIENQRYARPAVSEDAPKGVESAAELPSTSGCAQDLISLTKGENTEVSTSVTIVSRFGQRGAAKNASDEKEQRRGFFSTWSSAAVQRAIEASSVQRTRTAMVKSKEGMLVVLERIRSGGLREALEGMRKDRELVLAGIGGDANVQQAWQGARSSGESS